MQHWADMDLLRVLTIEILSINRVIAMLFNKTTLWSSFVGIDFSKTLKITTMLHNKHL